MKMSLLILSILLITASISFAQDSKVVNKEFKVEGNCNQCKTRIEKAVKIDEVKYAKWNKSTKILKVAFENTITVDSLQRRIAEVGHDTEKFKAINETYSELPNCCLYRGSSKTH